jgi:hypothetical protein
LTQTDLTLPTLKPTQMVLKFFPPHILKNNFIPDRIGTFGVCPTARPDPQQTPKEPILQTRNQNVEKNLTFFKVNKTDFITFDKIVKKYNSRCKQKI